MAGEKGDKDIFKAFEEETDAFFDSLMNSPKKEAKAPEVFDPPPREVEAAAAPAVKEVPEKQSVPKAHSVDTFDAATSATGSAGSAAGSGGNVTSAAIFRMDSDGSDEAHHSDHEPSHQDETLQMAPAPPAEFSTEDRMLHETLEDFYWRNRANNLANINAIVAKYRGANVVHLWAQLAIKYNVPPVEAVELLSRTLYQSSPYEYSHKELRTELEEAMAEVRHDLLAKGLSVTRTELLSRAVARGAQDGSDRLLRLLAFRGLPEDQKLRAQVWKALLGYLPMKRHDEWNAIQGEKRALYASYRSELLTISATAEVSIRNGPRSPGSDIADEELLQEIKNDVERTRRDFEYFRRPGTKAALTALLFVYAKLNPGVRYVQGMNEIAAVLLYVMSVDAESAESDAFWCFSEMMVEIKEGFMQTMDHSGEGVYGMVDEISRMLRSYDPQLARHLHKAELSLFVFVLRWCTVLFAQDATLPDVLRLWDSFIADPNRYAFVVCTCVAVILGKREALLATDKQFSLAEIMQAGPRGTDFEELLKRANAICAFERRGEQEPIFPPRRLQVMDDINEWASTAAAAASEAAAVASEVGHEVSKNIQEKIAPVVIERAGQASEIVQDKAQALQSWLHETAPARKEAFEQAQSHLSSFWQTVRTKGQQFAAEAATSETANTAAARFSSAAESASGLFDDAVRFFSQTMFTPAALIGSAALGLLFLQPAKFAFCNPRDQPYSIFQFLYRVYVILAASTICLELTTVLETSNAHVQLLELGRHGRLALEPTAMDLIMANMEFEYLVCSLSFFGGLVCFISATLCRVIVAFGYDHSGRFFPQEPELCLAVSGMMLSSLLSWLHLVNVRVTEFRNFGSMICRFFILLLARFRNGEVGIIGYAAVISSLASVAGVGKILLNEYLQIREGSKAGEDGP